MRKIDLGQTISILANLGVIAGIVFLAYELQQNNAALESQARMNHASVRADYFNRLSVDPVLTPIIVKAGRGEPLDDVEEARLRHHYFAMFVSWQWEWEEDERGQLEAPKDSWRNAMSVPLNGPPPSPGARTVWEQTRQGLKPAFVEFMENEVLN